MNVDENISVHGKSSLRGALDDYGVQNLLQLFQSTFKTGELVLVDEERCARIYFVDGDLIHAEMDDLQGPPVLRDILGWASGEFDFRQGVQQSSTSLLSNGVDDRVDPACRLAEPAASTRLTADGVTFQLQLEKSGPASTADHPDEKLSRRLAEFISTLPSSLGAWIFDGTGAVLASACGTAIKSGESEKLKNLLCGLLASYPRGTVRRLFIEDSAGLLVFQTLDRQSCLLVLAGKDAVMGAIAVAVGRLAADILKHES